MRTFLLKHSETVPAKTIASSCVRCKEEAWNLCVSGHFVVRDLWQRAGEAWKIMRKALASVRANIAISLFGFTSLLAGASLYGILVAPRLLM